MVSHIIQRFGPRRCLLWPPNDETPSEEEPKYAEGRKEPPQDRSVRRASTFAVFHFNKENSTSDSRLNFHLGN